MAEHVEINFVGEIIAAERVEKIRPRFVGKLKSIDGVRRKQAAVVFGNFVRRASDVDEAEQILEVLPSRVGNGMEASHRIRLGNCLFGQQAAVFAKRDENDAIEQALGHLNGGVDGVIEVPVQIRDQLKPLLVVVIVKLVADFALAIGCFAEQPNGARWLAAYALNKSEPMEQNIEPTELVDVAERLQREMLVSTLGGVALVEPKADDVRDDSPPAGWRLVDEIVPALIDRSAATRAIAVEMNLRAF